MSAPAAEPLRPFDEAAEVLSLVARFEDATLPQAEWTHAAHLTMALWYASRLPYDAALEAMRDGILRLNQAHGVVTTPTRGYHETITRFYMQVICGYVANEEKRSGAGLGRAGEPAAPALRSPGPSAPALQQGPPHVGRGEIRLGGAGPAADRLIGRVSRDSSCRRSFVARRRTEPSWIRSPTRTTVPPRISGST